MENRVSGKAKLLKLQHIGPDLSNDFEQLGIGFGVCFGQISRVDANARLVQANPIELFRVVKDSREAPRLDIITDPFNDLVGGKRLPEDTLRKGAAFGGDYLALGTQQLAKTCQGLATTFRRTSDSS
jgi:hypothetical protein